MNVIAQAVKKVRAVVIKMMGACEGEFSEGQLLFYESWAVLLASIFQHREVVAKKTWNLPFGKRANSHERTTNGGN